MFEVGRSSIITNITEYIPLIYAVQSLPRRVGYLLELLIKHKIEIPEIIREEYGYHDMYFSHEIPEKSFFEIIKNEKTAIPLFDSIEYQDHLKYRMYQTFKEIKNASAVNERLQKSIKDVSRQIKRLYVYRNKIAHMGHFENIRPQLINHLNDYLSCCYKAIFETLEIVEEGGKISLKDALFAYKLGADDVYYHFNNKTPVRSYDYESLIVLPVI